MAIRPGQLLKRLEPPVRPVATGAVTAGRPPFELMAFDEMLTLVSRGEIRSDRPVIIDGSIDMPIETSQLTRLASAADLAESEGAQRAVMLMDGRSLVMDVAARTVTRELSGHAPFVRDIDAAVFVADPESGDIGAHPLVPGVGLAWSSRPTTTSSSTDHTGD